MRQSARVLIGMTAFALLAVALGCGKGSTGTSTPTGPNPVASTGGDATQLFAQNCQKCHATEAGKRGKGPSLAGIGSKPDRSVDWIIAHIKNPTTHKPTSGMTAFEGKLSDADLKALAEYLLTLK
jgi:mono/diheme cytochrome c family protein